MSLPGRHILDTQTAQLPRPAFTIMPPDAPSSVTPRDLFLARDLSEKAAQGYLADRGFRDPVAADTHLQQLADDLPTRLALGELADLLVSSLAEAPDPDAALVGLCRYVATRVPKSSMIRYLHDDPRALQVLTMLLGASPFLSEVLIRNPEYFHWLQNELDASAPDLVDYREELDRILGHDSHFTRRLDALKRFKRREMLRIAGRDLLNKDTLQSSTRQLSDLADIVTDGAIAIVRDQMVNDRNEDLPDSFVVIGMGKLGGRELNYSSDVDLIYIYEAPDDAPASTHERFQRFGRKLTSILSEYTDEGYLYRVDLRLRPMGKRGNVVYSLQQSAQYYETMAETFERFAMIKARPIAGDLDLGRRFLAMTRPFVYRKYLDHAAIEELARYKARSDRQHAKGDTGDRNVKVGRGGIREIELFTQVFQLIYGGTHTELQDPNTLSALQTVNALGFIDDVTLRDLRDAYGFLRRLEHRLQVVQEGQTHTLSDEAVELVVTARRLGFDTETELLSTLEMHRDKVHAVYSNLLERRSEDAEFQGRQLFRLLSGELSDAEATEHVVSLGFPDPDAALGAIRGLDDVTSITHSKTATRNLLANLLATVLSEISECGAPTRVLNRLEQVVARTGGASSLYRSLLENDQLRGRLLLALDAGDLFAQRLGRYPELLDFLVTASLDLDDFRQAVAEGLAQLQGPDLAASADPFRRFKAIEEFKAILEWLVNRSLPTLNQKLSLVADAALQWSGEHAENETLLDGDGSGGGAWGIYALGKLGGRELTVHSDLDLVFLYDGDTNDSRAFERHQAFVRAIHAFLEAPTAAGYAYRLDTRLRPEGKKGALAVPVRSFSRYLETRAEVWERMAWTRGRFVAGSRVVETEVAQTVERFVYGSWKSDIPSYARHIRSRMEHELAKEQAEDRLDLKVGMGGLADIDFLLQLVQMREGATRSEFRVAGTRQLLSDLPRNDVVDEDDAARLRVCYEFLRTLETVLRIQSDSSRGWMSTDPAELELVASTTGIEPATGEALLAQYREVTREVRDIFEKGMQRLEKRS